MDGYIDRMDPIRKLVADRLDIADIEVVRHAPFVDGVEMGPTYFLHLENMINPEVFSIRIAITELELRNLELLGALSSRYTSTDINRIIARAHER